MAKPLTAALNAWQRALLASPLFYRLKGIDFLLPGLFLSGLVTFLAHRGLAVEPRFRQLAFLLGFLVFVAVMNRCAWLASGRGAVHEKRLDWAVRALLADGKIDAGAFCLRARVPFPLFLRALERAMAEEYTLGYLDVKNLVLVVADRPTDKGKCPACGGSLSEHMVIEKACGFCGTVFYL